MYNLIQPGENNFDLKAVGKATHEMSSGRFSIVIFHVRGHMKIKCFRTHCYMPVSKSKGSSKELGFHYLYMLSTPPYSSVVNCTGALPVFGAL